MYTQRTENSEREALLAVTELIACDDPVGAGVRSLERLRPQSELGRALLIQAQLTL